MNPTLFLASTVLLLSLNQALACDSCAIYSATEAMGESTTGFFAGLAEQYTDFDTTQINGHEVPNVASQHLDSFITQAVLGYNITPRFSVQANIPYVYRSFRRPEGFLIDKDTEQGFGDASLVGKFLIVREDTADFTFTWNAMAGVKLPTGSADRIKEEFGEVETPGAPESGIHGHDLALGSGSFDGILGSSAFLRYERFFATASFHYDLRSEGDYHYRYANEFSWDGGVGVYLAMNHDYTVALQAVVSTSDKDTDKFLGTSADDTAMHAIYLGPKLVATWKDRLAADLEVDLPVRLDNSAFQAVPDFRIRTGVTWRF
jgi:hypothetical protein